MNFIIRTETAILCSEHRCAPRKSPLNQFAEYVKDAVKHGYERVSLIRVMNNGSEVVLESWVNDTINGQIFKYKIHSLSTAQKGPQGGSNSKFYETADEALVQATKYVTRNDNPQSMVIYKAIKIVRVADRPVLVEDVD